MYNFDVGPKTCLQLFETQVEDGSLSVGAGGPLDVDFLHHHFVHPAAHNCHLACLSVSTAWTV